jgi:hypothetical protein
MSQEATILEHHFKLDNRKTAKQADTGMNTLERVNPLALSSKRNLTQRIRDLFSKVSKSLEGDQEYHKYLGM